ncbi:MAG: hypothetical protein Q7S98_00125, partial [Deltaproteobacteria bacterium]|nr:hypothetical protein [Deltaproteobacteria bacterium]
MRSPSLGIIPELAKHFGPEFSLEMFRRGSFVRHFEYKVKEAYDKKLFQFPIYLSIAQEFNAGALSMALKGCNIFAQHRCHGIYLS